MKKNVLIIIGVALMSLIVPSKAQAPFSKGVNLTGWFQTTSTNQIQFSKYTKQDFQNIKSLGCDVIRLPINMFYMTSGSPNYTVNPLFYDFLDQAVTWAEDLQMYLIIDNHTTDDLASKNANLQTLLTNVWTQVATHYKDRSTYILYEILNEPNGISTANWGAVQQAGVNAIRAVDTKHTIIVGASNFNTYSELSSLPNYSDSKLIYTFHFYDPFVFTHQGATWPTPSMGTLANVPFPYNSSTMPATPSDLVGTWVGSSLSNYSNDGTVAKMKSLIDIAVAFKNARNVNLYCGEFGVYIPNSPNSDRTYWYGEIRNYLESKGIAWTVWDYQGGFGLFKKGSNEQFNYDLNTTLLTSLGLTVPTQQVYTLKPDSVGFNIYSDYIGAKISESSNPSGGVVNYYSTSKPNNNKYCLNWAGSGQYGAVGFDFLPNKDLSMLKNNNYALSFLVRGNTPGTKFDLRFIDTKTGASDHPWRMNFTMDENTVRWDGQWHKVYIPLSNFVDGGAWDNTWFNPIGAFDWMAVDRFDITAEQMSLVGKSLWFDNIQICNMDTAKVYETTVFTAIANVSSNVSGGLKAYPNPAESSTTVNYSLASNEKVDISIYDLSGQKIRTLFNSLQTAGNYSLTWNIDTDNGKKVLQGVYFCRIKILGREDVAKIIVM